jgi:hypothetical protein
MGPQQEGVAMMNLTHWLALSNQASRQAWGEPLDRRRWLHSAVARGAFWGMGDCQAAWQAMRWVTLQQPLGSGDLDVHWGRFVDSRVAMMQALTRRGLESGAFRHPQHARNALEKLRRAGDRDQDLLDAWEQEIDRRLREATTSSTA